MTQIVAGLFEDQLAAERTIDRLKAMGSPEGTITTFVVNPPGMHHTLKLGGDAQSDEQAEAGPGGAVKGAAIGGAVGIAAGLAMTPLVGPVGMAAGISAGAFVGALAGASNAMGDEPVPADTPIARPGGVMVAANVESIDAQPVIDTMRESGAKLVELTDGEWRNGDWVDFDPVRPPRNVVVNQGAPGYPT